MKNHIDVAKAIHDCKMQHREPKILVTSGDIEHQLLADPEIYKYWLSPNPGNSIGTYMGMLWISDYKLSPDTLKVVDKHEAF